MALKGTFDNQHRHQTKTTRTSLYKRKQGSFLKEGIKKKGIRHVTDISPL